MGDITTIPGVFEGLLIITVLSVLCGGWVAFQMWLHKHDPKKSGKLFENRCGGCASGGCSMKGGRAKRSST